MLSLPKCSQAAAFPVFARWLKRANKRQRLPQKDESLTLALQGPTASHLFVAQVERFLLALRPFQEARGIHWIREVVAAMFGQRTLQLRGRTGGCVRWFAMLALLAGAWPAAAEGCAWADAAGPAQQAIEEKARRENLANFGEATPTLYRGAQPSKAGFAMLAKMGVNIVVDLRGDRDSERKIVTGLGMEYVPMPWECSFPKDKTFADFLTLLRKNRGKKVFVHCRLGDDRTSMMIVAYRMAEEGWSAEKAEKEMEQYGYSFVHRRLICAGMLSYEEHFPERFRTSPVFRELR